jgi:site-specific recombinase XerD
VFEQLFEGPRALARQRSGPLVEERRRYLNHLAAQGLARKSLRHTAYYLLAVADSLRLSDRPGEVIDRAEIEHQAVLWANRSPRAMEGHRARAAFLGYARGWLGFLGRLQPLPTRPRAHAEHVDAFADYLGRERGLSPQTVRTYCPAVEKFLDDLDRAGHTLEHLTICPIDETLLGRIRQGAYARRTVAGLARALRSFFRYAHHRGWCQAGLAEAIKAPRIFAQESLPVGPSWPDVQRLLASTEGDRPVDVRDRAILMLLAVYGFRAGEVVRLRLEDFDWERELLRLGRPKTQALDVYPLSHGVGEAVLGYLRVRPRGAWRQVFLSHRAPIHPLSRSALWPIVAERLRRLGVASPHRGPHALRHACATHLLEQGLSLKEIGDHLGHRQPDTTRLYAKVDLLGLRRVADFDLGGLL